MSELKVVLDRLKLVPKYLIETEDLLRKGIRSGLMLSKEAFEHYGVEKEFKKLQVTNVEKSEFYKPFSNVKKIKAIF